MSGNSIRQTQQRRSQLGAFQTLVGQMETVYCHQFHAGSAGSWNLVIFGGNLVKESWYFFTQEVQVVTWSWNLGEEESSQHQERLHGVENETNDSSWGWNQERSLPCRDIDQPGGWHGSSPEWLGTVRELSSSNEDKTDYLFTVPIEILKGCSCKTVEDVGATNLPRGMDALPSLVLANNWHRSSYPRILIHTYLTIWWFYDKKRHV